MKANRFNTSVGMRLLGSNPIAVVVSARGGRWRGSGGEDAKDYEWISRKV